MQSNWRSSTVYPDLFIKEYIDYEIDDSLRSLVTGKNIAYVGPASNITGLKQGEYIDSFDVVAKVGFLKKSSNAASQDIGNRADIIIHSFNQFEIPVAKKNMDYFLESRFVICPMVSNDYIKEHEEFFTELRNIGCKVQNIDDRYLYEFFKKVGTVCNIGLGGIDALLKYDIKSIFITGISFYNMGRYGKIYNPDYFQMVSSEMGIYSNIENINPDSARVDLHNQEAQIDYFRELCKKDKRIVLDDYLKNNLY
jgi:hypothetical protein